MTYEEYKKGYETNNKKSSNIIKSFISKLLTIIIFTMIVITVSNYSEKFRNFVINDVLSNSMDFSIINKFTSKFTNIFKSEDGTTLVSSNNIKEEKYLDGIKYLVGDNESVKIKSSGIVTYIGKKDGYNNTIVIQQSDGYYAWYGNVKESVKLYDYIESGNVIGSASGEYYYVLYKDDKPVTNES